MNRVQHGKKNRKYSVNIINYLQSVISYIFQIVVSHNTTNLVQLYMAAKRKLSTFFLVVY